MVKDKDFSVLIKSRHFLFYPVLFIPVLKHSGKEGKIKLTKKSAILQ